MVNIAPILEKFTAAISNFDTERNYISLSHIALNDEDIINTYLNGFKDDLKIRLRCYKGYQMEKDLILRILSAFPGRAQAPFPEIKITMGDIVIAGHPDIRFDDYPGDCKSVPLDEHLPEEGKLPRKVYWQMQGYMLYSKKDKGLVIYESRETGSIRHYWLRENKIIQAQIEQKIERVVSALQLHLIRKDAYGQ